MHGLVNRAIQGFVEDTYGREVWLDVARRVELGFTDFEAMLHYDLSQTTAVVKEISDVLGKPEEAVREDIGTYLVTHPNLSALRRLLRFSGVTFVEFLHSLDDLPDRTRLAVPDLELPSLELNEIGPGRFSLVCSGEWPGYGCVVLGLLRGMADDYGALVLMDVRTRQDQDTVIDIALVEQDFSEGRSFELARKEV